MEAAIGALFERYERFFNDALRGTADMGEFSTFYATDMIAASPSGVTVAKNDESLYEVAENGYARYRRIGTKEMRLRNAAVTQIDDLHCIARIGWTATYRRQGQPDAVIDFEVHYLVQCLDGTPRIFGWISGDERALLAQHGIG